MLVNPIVVSHRNHTEDGSSLTVLSDGREMSSYFYGSSYMSIVCQIRNDKQIK